MAKFFSEEVVTEGSAPVDVSQKEGVELFKSTMELVLKRWEKRDSQQSREHYYMFFFDMCVRFNPDNQRDNRYLLVPIYCSADVAARCLAGIKNPKDKTCKIDVVFTPSLYKGKTGMFSNFRAEIENIEVLNAEEEPF